MEDTQIAPAADTQTTERSAPPQAEPEARAINSVDATAHQPLVARVVARKLELEALLASLADTDLTTRSDINLALSTISDLLTGDLDNVPAVVAVDLNRWLERTKHVAGHMTLTTTTAIYE